MAGDNGQDIKELIEQLKDDEYWTVRQTAAQELGKLGPQAKDAAEALWERIKQDDDPDVAGAAWDAVEAIDKDRFSDPEQLKALLSAQTWQFRQRAAQALGELGPQANAAAEALWERIKEDDDPDVVQAAWDAIQDIQKGTGQDWLADAGKLQELLDAKTPQFRQRAAQALGELGPQANAAAEALWDGIKQDDDDDVVKAAWDALKAIQKDTAKGWLANAGKLQELLSAKTWQVRERAAKSLQTLDPKAEAVLDELWNRIKQDDWDDVARAAWDAVKTIQEGSREDWSTDTEKLKALLEAKTAFARTTAAQALANLVNDKDNPQQLGTESEQRRLKEQLSEMAYLDDDADVRSSAKEAASAIRVELPPAFYSDILKPKLIPRLESDNWEARQTAAQALGELGRQKKIGTEDEVKDALAKLWETVKHDDDRDVVMAAWNAIKAIQKDTDEWLAGLQALLDVGNWQVRQMAAQALGELGPQAKDAAEKLWVTVKQDADVDVAAAAWDAVEAIDEDRASDPEQLMALLSAQTWQVRARAAKSLQAKGPDAKAALEALWERINEDDDDDVVKAAWEAVEAIQEDGFTDTKKLKALLEAKNAPERKRAAEKLANLAEDDPQQLGSGPEQQRLKERLSEMAYLDDDAEVRLSAEKAADAIDVNLPDAFYSDNLKRKLMLHLEPDKLEGEARRRAAQALGELGRDKKIGKEKKAVLDKLWDTIKQDNDPDLVKAAWDAVEAIDKDKFSNPEQLQALLEAVNSAARQRAAKSLQVLGPKAEVAADALWETIKQNDDDDVTGAAWDAIKAIQKGGKEDWLAVAGRLQELLKLKEPPQVRKMAAQKLEELGREKKIGKEQDADAALDKLWDTIKKDNDPDVVKAAWNAVEAIQEGAGEDWLADPSKLEELLDAKDLEARQSAAEAAIQALVEQLSQQEADKRKEAARKLRDLGPAAKKVVDESYTLDELWQRMLDELWKTVKQDKNPDVVVAAWDALNLKAIQKDDTLTIDLGDGRPDATGTIDGNRATVTFPDDGTFIATLVNPRLIQWSNGTEWRKPPDMQAFGFRGRWETEGGFVNIKEGSLAHADRLKELLDAENREAQLRAAKELVRLLRNGAYASDMESLLERLWAKVVEQKEEQDVRLAAAAAIASGTRTEDLGRLVGVGEKIGLGQWLVASDPTDLKDKMWGADPQATMLIVLTVFEDDEQQDEQDRALWQEARRQAARWLVGRAKQLAQDCSADSRSDGDTNRKRGSESVQATTKDKLYEWLWLVRRLQQLRRKNCELDVQHSLTEALSALWPVFTSDAAEALQKVKADQQYPDLCFDRRINQMLEYCRADRPRRLLLRRRSKLGQALAHTTKDASDPQNAPKAKPGSNQQNAREANDASDEQKALEAIAQLGFIESPDFVRVLVENWVDWIADLDKPHMVETTAEAMRYNPEVIAHLLGQYDKGLDENEKRVCQILRDNLRESFTGAFKYIQAQEYIQAHEEDSANGKNSARNERIEELLDGLNSTRSERIKELLEWLESRPYMPEEFTQMLAQLKQELRGNEITKEAEILVRRMVDLLVRTRLKYREGQVRQRIAKQLALMSDRTRFERAQEDVYDAVADELQRHAVSQLGARLRREEDIESRRSMARTLANLSGRVVGGRDAVEALAEAVVGEERQQQRRQQMLNDYYLKPSRERSDEAAEILKGAVGEAKKTLGLIQKLSSLVVVVGTVVLLGGLFFSFAGGDNVAQRVAGALAGLGGFAGVIAFLIKDPLNRIQNAVSNLVQLEAAFTSFIWELNLNSTYIQSQYVKKGELSDTDIARTVQRIEDAMSLAISLVQRYTREGEQRITRISSLSPVSDQAGKQVTIHGQHLNGDSPQQPGGLAQLSPQASQTKNGHSHKIFVNHKPIDIAKTLYWTENAVHFELPTQLPDLVGDEGVIWLSLSVDGMETNALPFLVVKNQDGQTRANTKTAKENINGTDG